MKKCPFCREQIQEDAIKCRFCASSLLPVQSSAEGADKPAGPGPNQVQYILDQDLIRFAKFVGGALAIFITVGAFLWGFDIKHADDQARAALEEVKKTQEDINRTADFINARQKVLKPSLDRLNASLNEAKLIMESLEKNKSRSDELIVVQLTRSSPTSAATIKTSTPVAEPLKTPFFTVPQLAKLYNFPPELTGRGQTIGLIEMGGGYRASDLTHYFTSLKLPVPAVKWIGIDGSRNSPSTADGADGQVALDIEVAGAVAPGARIVVYFAPNTTQGFLDAIRQAINDKSSVISVAWGSAEKTWTAATIRQMNDLFKLAADRHITVVTASGDQGATDGQSDGQLHVDFPASSPYVLACGGTQVTATTNGSIYKEVVWHESNTSATGGGFSTIFPTPDWQGSVPNGLTARPKGRGIPDVSANADPATGYAIYVDGQPLVIGGSAATAPLWAGLVALINQGVGHNIGYINPVLYKTIGPSGAFNDVTQGNNTNSAQVGGYSAQPGWDACTGWGSPDGRKLLNAFRRTN